MDATKITTGVRRSLGGVFRAPAGTALPANASSTLAGTYVDQGYISEDGITKSKSRETTEVKDWGGAPVVVLKTSETVTFQFSELETLNVDVLKSIYGSNNVTGTLATGVKVLEKPAYNPEEAVYVIDEVSLNGVLERTVIPRGVITEIGDEIHKRDEVLAYDITVTALVDSSGVSTYKYIVTGSTGATS